MHETSCVEEITKYSGAKLPAAIKIETDGTTFNLYGFVRELLLRRRDTPLSLQTRASNGEKDFFNIYRVIDKASWLAKFYGRKKLWIFFQNVQVTMKTMFSVMLFVDVPLRMSRSDADFFFPRQAPLFHGVLFK